MPTTFQLLRAGNGKIVRSANGKPFGNNVSVPVTSFPNGSRRRMPYAVSRDLQPAVIAGKELYFRVTHSDLRTVANGGLSQSGLDFQFETLAGAVVPYVVKSYDAVAGTLFGVFVNNLAGSAAATRGYLYFNNTGWTSTREDKTNTFLNGNTCLFLPSGINQADIGIDMSGNLPTSDKVIVNPGALLNGSTDYIWRALSVPIDAFLISCFCQDLDANSDNALWAFGVEGGNTVIFIRRLFGTASGATGSETNAWRFGWVTKEPGAAVTSASFYETGNNTSGTNLQHVVIRRFTNGTDPEIYLNGVLTPIAFKSTPLTANAAQRGPIATTGQRLLIGRGSVPTRFWHGYIDCFKFYSGDNKTATWAKSEYDNLLDIDGAVIFGDPETATTATMFGETINITCNGLNSVAFPADKYVANDVPLAGTPPATPSIQSLTQPAGGTFAVVTGNQVQYTNTSNTDPDDGGEVVMTNGSGTVTIPVRATVNPSAPPPPPGGYFKTPNIAGKAPVDVGSRGAAGTPGTLLWAIAQFAAGTFSTTTRYIRITGAITGADVTVNAGGTSTHPLVIMMAAPSGADNWTSRASTKITGLSLILTRDWTWCYGLYGENIPTGPNTSSPELITVNASHCFVTCCRIGGSHCVANNFGAAVITNLTVNFNRLELSMQSTLPDANGDTAVRLEGGGQLAAFKVATQTIAAYNLIVDHAIQRVVSAKNAIGFYCGNGVPDQTPHYQTGSVYEFNFINASLTRGMEFKYGPLRIKNNHIIGNASQYAGINLRGGNVKGVILDNNRVLNVNRCELQGGDHKISNLWVINDAGAVSGKIALTCQEQPIPPKAKWLEAGDGSVLVGCKGNVQMPCIFEIWPYDGFSNPTQKAKSYNINANLGQVRHVTIAAHVAGAFTGANDETIPFDGTGRPTGAHDALTNAGITKQAAVLAGYSVTTPPVLNATICGPNDGNGAGKVWGT